MTLPARFGPPRLAARLWAAALSIAALIAGGCGAPPTPEAQVRAHLAAAEEAFEERSLRRLADFISDAYRDPEGRDKAVMLGIVAYHVRQSESIHLLVRVRSIRFPGPAAAEVRVLVAAAGAGFGPEAGSPRLDADVLAIEAELRLEEDGVWRVASARWRPAARLDIEGEW